MRALCVRALCVRALCVRVYALQASLIFADNIGTNPRWETKVPYYMVSLPARDIDIKLFLLPNQPSYVEAIQSLNVWLSFKP